MFWQRHPPTTTFATNCWEKDWRLILEDPIYLSQKQINNHCFPFSEKLLVINNVLDLDLVKKAAQKKIDEGVLDRYVVAEEKILPFFNLKRSDFQSDGKVNNDWVYYNAIAPLTAIFEAKSDYLLYLTGDVYLEKKVDWVGHALKLMEKNPNYKVANPTWNEKYGEAKKESHRRGFRFFIAKEGFSDQLFLVRRKDFCAPIYTEILPDSHHFPRGGVFEKRVFSFMKTRGWERITYRHGSYTHENV
jgi:hypothetical protein